ncbi:glycosyltransferase [Amycolatopsis lexingtonensis]|uniref:glycosyltransferase n=1 Tax=Amycolatopsis lexingtonensis TaxID=218822 RepID=UPI003F6EA0AA
MITFGLLSTYPPTLCGLASFTASLRAALPPGAAGGVVRAVESAAPAGGPEVVGDLVAGSPESCRAAAALLDRDDVAIVQHEYGIYGGPDGEDVLGVLELLRVPAIVVLHTVLSAPTPHQRAVLDRVLATAAAVVVMSETARARLVAGYDVPAGRLVVIPHGAPDNGGSAAVPHHSQHRQILTWGLLGPGKGIEWGIEAMALLPAQWPEPRYLVAGRTHPKVQAQQGESYRRSLQLRTERLGVRDRVRFDARYLAAASLRRLVAHAEVVLLPYDSRDQVTSGVLIEAVTSRTPVVATRFPHAVELLSGGAGLLVDHRDPAAIAHALQEILTDRAAAGRMAAAAGIVAGSLGWASVAARYSRLGAELVSARPRVVA